MASLVCDDDDDDQSDFQTPVICGDCEGNRDVRYVCLACDVNICEKCKGRRLHRQHRVLPRGHPEVTKARKTTRNPCTEHLDKEYVTFCRTCNVPCCPDCIAGKHNEHSFCSIDEAADKARKEIHNCLSALEETILPSLEQRDTDISVGIGVYKESMRRAREQCRNRCKAFKEALERAEDEFLKQSEELEISDIADMETSRRHNGERTSEIKQLIAACKTNLEEKSDLALLEFRLECHGIEKLEPGTIALPALLRFLPSSFELPTKDQLLGKLQKGKNKRQIREVQTHKQKDITGGNETVDTGNFIVENITTVDDIDAFRFLHNGDKEIWGYTATNLTLYDADLNKLRKFEIEFFLNDIALLLPQGIIGTDYGNNQVVKVSRTGKVKAICSTGTLSPGGICINDRNQIVIGVRNIPGFGPPITKKLVIISPDGSTVLQEIEFDENGKPLFTREINQVKQKRDGEYVASDIDRVLCIDREGGLKWKYKVADFVQGPHDVQCLFIDSYDNIIIAEENNNRITILDNRGNRIGTLVTAKDGIDQPRCLTLDSTGRLYIGQRCGNAKIVKYRYLK